MATRSAEDCEMSRSCQSGTFSSPTSAAPRTTRARPHKRLREGVPPAIELDRQAGELPAERRGLGVHTMRAADADGPAVLLRAGHDGRECSVDALDEKSPRLLDLQRERRVDDVRRRQA